MNYAPTALVADYGGPDISARTHKYSPKYLIRYHVIMRKQRHTAYQNCPVEVVLDLIGGKWKSMILFHVATQTRRFNELRRLLPAVTQRILTQQLRELESDGLITRTIYAEVPPRVEYAITPLGASLGPILGSLKDWAETHVPERIALTAGNQEENA